MSKNEEDFKRLTNTVNANKQNYLSKQELELSANALAKIHIKENINWYRIKYKSFRSSTRNDYIVEYVSSSFSNIDEKELSNYLIRFGILTFAQFVWMLIFIALILLVTLHQYHGHGLITAFSAVISPFLILAFTAIYDTTSIIKLYWTSKRI